MTKENKVYLMPKKTPPQIRLGSVTLKNAAEELPSFSEKAKLAVLQAAASPAQDEGSRPISADARKSKFANHIRKRRWKSTAVAAALLVLTLGTVFAITRSYDSRFMSFFSDDGNGTLAPDSASYLLADSHDGVALVIDGVFPKDRGHIIIASLINESGIPWHPETTEVNRLHLQTADGEPIFYTNRMPVLSEDGMRLSFVLEMFDTPDNLAAGLVISVKDFLTADPTVEKDVMIPLSDLYENNGAYVEQPRFAGDEANAVEAVEEALNKTYELTAAEEYPAVVLTGVGIVRDRENTHFSGIYIFLKNKMEDVQSGWLGYQGQVQEITNLRTGETETWSSRMGGGTFGPGRFQSISVYTGNYTAGSLADYAVTKVSYHSAYKTPGLWEIQFPLPDRQETISSTFVSSFIVGTGPEAPRGRNEHWVTDALAEAEITAHLSPLGISLEGYITSVKGDRDGHQLEIREIYDQLLEVTVFLKDGREMELSISSGRGIDSETREFYNVYYYEQDDYAVHYLVIDPEDVDYAVINGETVYFN